MIFSLHGWVALASILLGIGGMANYLVPLMIGAEDMAFPRLNAFAYWINVPGIVTLMASLLVGGWDSGWTAYPPLSLSGAVGYQFMFWGVFAIGLSSILGSLNLIATILLMRPKGMSLFRMPIFCWAVLATSLIQLTATQFIGIDFLMMSFERSLGMPFFNPMMTAAGVNMGGEPLLHQHLFWFYSHPAVYVFVLPGLGIISELLPVFARKPLFGYRWVALSSLAIALVGFLVWGHHMFTSGYQPYLRVAFMISTLLVAVPTGVKFFSWLGTMWGGRLTFPTPMLFTLGAISVFLIGGLSGPVLATVTTDLYLHDTYFVVGHFHATIFGGFVFPFFAAIYLLVSEDYRAHVQRNAGQAALLDHDAGLLGHEHRPDVGGRAGHAPPDCRLRPGVGNHGRPDCGHAGRLCDCLLDPAVYLQPLQQRRGGRAGRRQSVALTLARMADSFACAGAQLCQPHQRGRRAL